MKFYNNVDDRLKPYIRHYWSTAGYADPKQSMQLLLMDHYDIIVQIEGDFEFIVNNKTIPINCPMVHGLRHENIVVKQNYYVHTFGISFTPWGFHFFYRASMAELTDRVVKLSKCIHELNDAIMKNTYLDINGMISTVEEFFLNNLQNGKNININYDLIRSYIYHDLTLLKFVRGIKFKEDNSNENSRKL